MADLKRPKPYKPWNPAIVGAVLGVICAVIAMAGRVTHDPSPNTLLQDPFSAAAIGGAWGVAIAMVRNWLNERKRRS